MPSQNSNKLGLQESGNGLLIGYQGDNGSLNGLPFCVGSIVLTGQTANIAATNVGYQPVQTGLFLWYAEMEMTTGGGAATYTVNAIFTGEAGARTQPLCTVLSTTTGTISTQTTMLLKATNATAFQYSVTSGGAAGTYSLSIAVFRLS